MDHISIFLFLSLNLNLIAQSGSYTGNYEARYKTDNQVVIKYSLSLNTYGTFLFHFYRNINSSQPEENNYGRGTWTTEKNLVIFHANKNDIDEALTLNFNGSKARIIRKSPRNISSEVIKEAILFYKSDIFWVERMKLFKK